MILVKIQAQLATGHRYPRAIRRAGKLLQQIGAHGAYPQADGAESSRQCRLPVT
jgi:hypothetical protein